MWCPEEHGFFVGVGLGVGVGVGAATAAGCAAVPPPRLRIEVGEGFCVGAGVVTGLEGPGATTGSVGVGNATGKVGVGVGAGVGRIVGSTTASGVMTGMTTRGTVVGSGFRTEIEIGSTTLLPPVPRSDVEPLAVAGCVGVGVEDGVGVGVEDGDAETDAVGAVGATWGIEVGLGAFATWGDGTTTAPPVLVVTAKLGTKSAGWVAALFGVTALEPRTMTAAVAAVVIPTRPAATTIVLVDVAAAA